VQFFISNNPKRERKAKMEILLSFWWQIWKERNRRIFNSKEASVIALACLTKEAISNQRRAASLLAGDNGS
jgi:hypothetical protein